MITTEYIGFFESLMSSLLGMSIVFLSLVFLAIFVTIVSKVISSLEKNLTSAVSPTVVTANTKPVASPDAAKIAVIAAAVSEERRESLDSFVITNIQKI